MPKAARLLVVDGERAAARDLERALARLGYTVAGVESDGEGALRAAAATRPDLALVEVTLSGARDGLETARLLSEEHDVPTVFVAAGIDEAGIERAREARALGFVLKPIDERQLKISVETALDRWSAERAARERSRSLSQILMDMTANVMRADAGIGKRQGAMRAAEWELQQLRAALQFAAEGVCRLDAQGRFVYVNQAYNDMIGCAGSELIGQAWQTTVLEDDRPAFEQAYLRMQKEGKVEIDGRAARRDGSWFFQQVTMVPVFAGNQWSGHFCFTKDITERKQAEEALRAANAELVRSRALIHELAVRDELTGIPNRRELLRVLDVEVARCRRHNRPLALMMVDIDHFKGINDQHGHQAGDQAIATVARLIRESLRPSDTPGRYGGEEIAIVLPETTALEAEAPAERIRAAIEDAVLTVTNLQQALVELRLTVSLGIASLPDDARESDALLRAADAALYAAKRGGRNRAVLFRSLLAAVPGVEGAAASG